MNTESRENPYAKMSTKEINHPNGLLVRIPEVAAYDPDTDGFSIVPPSSRGMSAMSIMLAQDKHTEQVSNKSEKKIGTRTLEYWIDKSESEGSSGDRYTITAQERTARGWTVYEQGDYAELNAPPFDFFWTVVEGTSLK